MFDEFHFLRPGWLAIVPVAAFILWWWLRARARGGAWQRLVDPQLQQHVLVRASAVGDMRWPILTAFGIVVAAALALSGPSFERLPVPAYRTDAALVVALDLSRSMDATDVAPSRLARAKIKLLSLLERRAEGETALVVFSSHAFTVTPLTTDTRTIAALVGSVSTDIMPSQGSYAAAGLDKAAELLRQAGHQRGDIVLFSDADVDGDAIVMARDLREEGYRVGVLAVGTAEGAPIPSADGGFVTDRTGDVVVPRTDLAGLQRLAATGGGRFAQLAPDDSDLERLLPRQLLSDSVSSDDDASAEDDYSADVWRDEGVWFTLALLPLLALGFRRGWVCVVAVACLVAGEPVHAFEWADLWQRPDQRGRAALEDGDAQAAAQLFVDRQWRGAAEYRAEEYATSAGTLAPVEGLDAAYNRGNALARSGQLEAAIAMYDEVLEVVPDHEDARYNRDLVAELLEQLQQQQEQQQQDQQAGQQDQQNSDSEASDEEGSESAEQSAQAGDSESNGEPRDNESEQPEEQTADNEEQQQPEDAQDPQQQESEQLSAALPEDIEEWASEQAADQWLRRVPQDPGGLLRRKFYYQYQRLGLDQDGQYVWPGNETEPW